MATLTPSSLAALQRHLLRQSPSSAPPLLERFLSDSRRAEPVELIEVDQSILTTTTATTTTTTTPKPRKVALMKTKTATNSDTRKPTSKTKNKNKQTTDSPTPISPSSRISPLLQKQHKTQTQSQTPLKRMRVVSEDNTSESEPEPIRNPQKAQINKTHQSVIDSFFAADPSLSLSRHRDSEISSRPLKPVRTRLEINIPISETRQPVSKKVSAKPIPKSTKKVKLNNESPPPVPGLVKDAANRAMMSFKSNFIAAPRLTIKPRTNTSQKPRGLFQNGKSSVPVSTAPLVSTSRVLNESQNERISTKVKNSVGNAYPHRRMKMVSQDDQGDVENGDGNLYHDSGEEDQVENDENLFGSKGEDENNWILEDDDDDGQYLQESQENDTNERMENLNNENNDGEGIYDESGTLVTDYQEQSWIEEQDENEFASESPPPRHALKKRSQNEINNTQESLDIRLREFFYGDSAFIHSETSIDSGNQQHHPSVSESQQASQSVYDYSENAYDVGHFDPRKWRYDAVLNSQSQRNNEDESSQFDINQENSSIQEDENSYSVKR
ncbi:hypothetical protein BCR33DRAFT_844827 [Rhizoclosmatium globosum]|uniref:Uncharacterized protein n=1 Tax=Rhizoclosmatium globosum TaxID=329046 RepID=A0A1Y2D302_9FUNG|nr:hypothetical protein BCR33DRAFT_844827 [Rhizoclosmatium globosum]|eukprot:ORY53514.1 hypothetical protein BCR33DRAFT_844827 [Rhizoclosmatium globosum]